MPRKPKPEQFELPHMPEKDTKVMSPVEIAAEKRKRNQYGLLPNLEYKFTEEGFVDWEAMVPNEFYYANKDHFGSDVDINSVNVAELPPEKKIIKLDGIKWLLYNRGAESVTYPIGTSYPDYASVKCEIKWTPNFEQDFQPWATSGEGEAHAFNNKSPFKYLVATLAENKALSRAVRLGCKIRSYSSDELRGENVDKEDNKSSNDEPSGSTAQTTLSDKMKKHKLPFDKMKKSMLEKYIVGNDEATMARRNRFENYTSVEDMQDLDCFFTTTAIVKIYEKS